MKINKFNEGEYYDDPIYGNDTRSYYYGVGDNLPTLVENLKIAAERGSEIAKTELILFKQIQELFTQSTLGSML